MEGPIKNVQSKDTGNIGHTKHGTNTKKKLKKDEHHMPHQKPGVNPGS